MKKKVCFIVLFVLFLVLMLAGAAYLAWNILDHPGSIEDEVVDTLPSATSNPIVSETSKPEQTPSPTQPPSQGTEVDRTVILEDMVKVKITGDDYVAEDGSGSDDVGVPSIRLIGGAVINGYDFSNGFILATDSRFTIVGGDTYGTLLASDSSLRLTVKEENALNQTVAGLEEFILKTYGFDDYIKLGCAVIPANAKLELDVGLSEYGSYFESTTTAFFDPTINDNFQLVADYTDECSYGNTEFLVIYNRTKGTFVAYAFVTCDRDRILHIKVEGSTLSKLWPAVVSVTNDIIRIIK